MSGRPEAVVGGHGKGGRLPTEKLHAFLADLQAAFLQGRFEDVAACYVFPLVVYTPAGIMLIRDFEQFGEVTARYREAIMALNVTSADLLIEESDQPYNHRLRATTRVTDFNADGTPVTGSLIRYFLIEDGDSFKIEMMEYLELPLPISDVERIIH